MPKILFIVFSLLFSVNTYASKWEGQWTSTFGKITLQEKATGYKKSSLVFGNYDKYGFLMGVSIDNQLHGVFLDTKLDKSGSFIFSLSKSLKNFRGKWFFDNSTIELRWNGSKTKKTQNPLFKGIDRFRSIEGTWDSNFGKLKLSQEGVFVEGLYDVKGKLFGVFNQENNVVYGLFTNQKKWGLLKFQLDESRKFFKGVWSWETNAWTNQKWDAKKINIGE